MGLDKSLFDQVVPEDVLCALCHKVLVNPVQPSSSCPHLFCSSCYSTRLQTASCRCPECGERLSSTSEPASVDVKMKLLNLLIKCSHGCGQVFRLSELPDHVSKDCPFTPVSCPHAGGTPRRTARGSITSPHSGAGGCRMQVKRSELAEHMEECDYRLVECEACGHTVMFRDLFTHQSRTRCLEKKLRQQLIKAIRLTNTDVKEHRQYLERQHLRLERQQRQRAMDHFRQNTATSSRLQQRRDTDNSSNAEYSGHTHSHAEYSGHTHSNAEYSGHTHSNAEYSGHTHSNAEYSGHTHSQGGSSGNESEHGSPPGLLESEHDTPAHLLDSDHNTPGLLESEHDTPAHLLESDHGHSPHHVHYQLDPLSQPDVFLTSSRLVTSPTDDVEMGTMTLNTPSPSRSGMPMVATCRNCNKQFRASKNAPNACRWHPGPIIELFGGTCYTCGRLDYQKGCMMGYHES